MRRVSLPVETRCTLCNRVIPDDDGEADALGATAADDCEEFFVIHRCGVCVDNTVISDGGDA